MDDAAADLQMSRVVRDQGLVCNVNTDAGLAMRTGLLCEQHSALFDISVCREHRAAGGGGQLASPALHPCLLRTTVLEHNVRHNMAIPKAFVQMHGKSLPGSAVDCKREVMTGNRSKLLLRSSSVSLGGHVLAETTT